MLVEQVSVFKFTGGFASFSVLLWSKEYGWFVGANEVCYFSSAQFAVDAAWERLKRMYDEDMVVPMFCPTADDHNWRLVTTLS